MNKLPLESDLLPQEWLPQEWLTLPPDTTGIGAIYIGKRYDEVTQTNVDDFCKTIKDRCNGKEITSWLGLPSAITILDYGLNEGPTLKEYLEGDRTIHPTIKMFIAYPVLKEV